MGVLIRLPVRLVTPQDTSPDPSGRNFFTQKVRASHQDKAVQSDSPDSSRRVAGRTDCVSARKLGLALNGSTIGNSVLNTRKKAFMGSCMRQLDISLFNE